jgi:hypothetical protein
MSRQEIKSLGATYIMECLMVDIMDETVEKVIQYFNEVYTTAPTTNEIRAMLNRAIQSHQDYIIPGFIPLDECELIDCPDMIKRDKDRIDQKGLLKVTPEIIKEREQDGTIMVAKSDDEMILGYLNQVISDLADGTLNGKELDFLRERFYEFPFATEDSYIEVSQIDSEDDEDGVSCIDKLMDVMIRLKDELCDKMKEEK